MLATLALGQSATVVSKSVSPASPCSAISLSTLYCPRRPHGSQTIVSVGARTSDRKFDEQNRQDGNGQRYWTGTLRTNPNVTLVGSLSRKGDQLVYSETIS